MTSPASPAPRLRISPLPNGLDVVVIPDHRAPVVTHMVWYRNGSADDPPGKSGIAHFLEHLMFKGTKRHPKGEFSEFISEVGGVENAFTGNDFTAYFQQIAKQHLKACMAFEADRMTGLTLTDDIVGPSGMWCLRSGACIATAIPARNSAKRCRPPSSPIILTGFR